MPSPVQEGCFGISDIDVREARTPSDELKAYKASSIADFASGKSPIKRKSVTKQDPKIVEDDVAVGLV